MQVESEDWFQIRIEIWVGMSILDLKLLVELGYGNFENRDGRMKMREMEDLRWILDNLDILILT